MSADSAADSRHRLLSRALIGMHGSEPVARERHAMERRIKPGFPSAQFRFRRSRMAGEVGGRPSNRIKICHHPTGQSAVRRAYRTGILGSRQTGRMRSGADRRGDHPGGGWRDRAGCAARSGQGANAHTGAADRAAIIGAGRSAATVVSRGARTRRGHKRHGCALRCSNLDANGNPSGKHPDKGTLYWHTDGSWRERTGQATMMVSEVVPDVGGETEFADMYSAYDLLPAAMKSRIEGRRAVHNFDFSRTRRHGEAPLTAEQKAKVPPVAHPIVRTHPDTGRKAIFLGDHAETIEGMDYDDGRALIEQLNEMITQPARVSPIAGARASASYGTIAACCIAPPASTRRGSSGSCAAAPFLATGRYEFCRNLICLNVRTVQAKYSMPIKSKYLFVASMDVDPDKEALFNEVYDTEHVPNLLKVPGVHAVARMEGEPFAMSIGGEERTVAHDGPRHSALYEIDGGMLSAANGRLRSKPGAGPVRCGRSPATAGTRSISCAKTLYKLR